MLAGWLKLTFSCRLSLGFSAHKICRDRAMYQRKYLHSVWTSNHTLHKHWSVGSKVMQPRRGPDITCPQQIREVNGRVDMIDTYICSTENHLWSNGSRRLAYLHRSVKFGLVYCTNGCLNLN